MSFNHTMMYVVHKEEMEVTPDGPIYTESDGVPIRPTPTFKVLILLLPLLLIVLVIVFLVIFLYNAGDDPVRVPHRPFPHVVVPNNIGASLDGKYGVRGYNGTSFADPVSCNLDVTREWTEGKCDCRVPFFGIRCDRETYLETFQSIGTITDPLEDLANPTSAILPTDRLSFPFQEGDTTCTGQCMSDENCLGVYWNPNPSSSLTGECVLIYPNEELVEELREKVVVNPSIDSTTELPVPYSPSVDSNLYLRRVVNGGDLSFTQRVFTYTGSLIVRYWNITSRYQDSQLSLVTCRRGVVNSFDFIPEQNINDGLLYGVFTQGTLTTDPETLADIIARERSGYVVLYPDNDRPSSVIPSTWKSYSGIYVTEEGY